MNRLIKISLTIMSLLILQSCGILTNVPRNKKVPAYTLDPQTSMEVLESDKMKLPSDTTKTIIVYNVIEKDGNKIISDETLRLLIADFFGTLTTVLTLLSIKATP